MSVPPDDAAARARIRDDLDTTLLVEAAAGTGKTTELVRRIIAVLAAGRASVESLAAVTFTEKAAGELKLRLRAGLEAARQQAPGGGAAARHLEDALARLEEARVSTIHGFCADLLRARPVEARVDPQFRVLTEGEAERLHREAFERWLQACLEEPPEGVRRALRRPGWNDEPPGERLRRASWELTQWRDFPTPWGRAPFARDQAIDALLAQMVAFADLTERGASNDPLVRSTAALRAQRDDWRRAEAVAARDYDALEGTLVGWAQRREFTTWLKHGRGAFFAREITRQAVLALHADLIAALTAFQRAADADLAAALHAALRESVAAYEARKAAAGALDFVDLLARARDLVRDDGPVRAALQGHLTHLFVDEFQDTDPLQAEILLLLAADDPAQRDWQAVRPIAGKLFIVGDPKQAIYRFRRADVGVYNTVKAQLLGAGAACVALTTSFRATPALQHFVNAAFAPRLTGDAASLQAAYVPLAPHRRDGDGQPALVALPVPAPYGYRGVTMKQIDASLPDAVGAFVAWLVHESGWTVAEREHPTRRVPVAARHVCLLFRRFSNWGRDITRDYVRALEARGVPHLLVGGKSFHDREEVETLRAALTAIEWPDDELATFATLRGSLFALGDERLLCWRTAHGRLHPFRLPAEPVAEALAPVATALRELADLHRARNRRPIADTIARLLDATRAHAAFALRPSGEQALANVLHLAELARTYERDGAVSFRGFVERLIDDAEHGQAAEAPILEEGSEGVRIMTAHKAKGLEFPVVVLADITAKQAGGVGRWIDAPRHLCAVRIAGWAPRELLDHETEEAARDLAEGVRVAYVAATRARDLLVVPAVGDAPFTDGWVSCLNDALYPDAAGRRTPVVAPGCPPFGADSVLERPPEMDFDADPVRPGLHARDGYGVAWWDPRALGLGAVPRFGIRQEELLDKDAPPALVDARLAAYRTWAASRAAARAAGARPSRRVATVTARAAGGDPGAAAVTLVELPIDPARPFGARFGALVHAVLASAALDAAPDGIAAAAALQGRLLGAPAAEIDAATAACVAALAHPLFDRARAAAICRREAPVLFVAADGTLVDGVVDLAFREPDGWVVVDFKTDATLAARLDTYRAQVALYAHGISAATHLPARGIVLRV